MQKFAEVANLPLLVSVGFDDICLAFAKRNREEIFQEEDTIRKTKTCDLEKVDHKNGDRMDGGYRFIRESCGRYNQNRGRTNFIAGYLMEKILWFQNYLFGNKWKTSEPIIGISLPRVWVCKFRDLLSSSWISKKT